MGARTELEAAHRKMTPAEVAEHALFLADLLSRAHRRVIPSMTAVISIYRTLIEAQRNTLASHNDNVRTALWLLNGGQAGKAREILERLAATAIPASPPLPITETPPLPDDIFSPVSSAACP